MKKLFHSLVAVLLLAVIATGANAAVLDRNLLPADTQWVAHLDMDMFKTTALKKSMVDKHNAFKKAEEKFFKETRVSIFKDIASITIFGSRENSRQMVFCVKGNLDEGYLLSQLKKAHEYKEVKYGKHTIYQWRYNQNGVFANKNMLLYSRDEDVLKNVLDLMSGKGKTIKGGNLSKYISMIPPNAFAFAAASDISNMAKHGYPGAILKQTGMASFLAMERNRNFTMKVMLNTNTGENARDIENIIRGLMAVANMAQQEKEGYKEKDHEEKNWMKLLQKVDVKTEGKTVNISFTYPSEALVDLFKHRGHGFHFH